MTWTNSIFIPRIDFSITKMALKEYFEAMAGNVSRVDFVSFNNEHGVGRRAFIHFSSFFNTRLKSDLMAGHVDVVIDGFQIRLIINKNPVPETRLNLNQVASNTEFIGEELKVQRDRIEALEKRLMEQADIIQSLSDNLFRTTHNVHYAIQRLHSHLPEPNLEELEIDIERGEPEQKV